MPVDGAIVVIRVGVEAAGMARHDERNWKKSRIAQQRGG